MVEHDKRRAAAGKKAAAALTKAEEALRMYVIACREAGEQMNLDDDRIVTRDRIGSLAGHLSAVFGSRP